MRSSLAPLALGGLILGLWSLPAHASLSPAGYSGALSTPTPEVLHEGTLALGFSWLDGPAVYLTQPGSAQTDRIYAITLGVLPGLEVTHRQTQVIGWVDSDAPGATYALDRMVSAKYRLPLPAPWPMVAVGMQDITSSDVLRGKTTIADLTQYGQSTLYAVAGQDQGWWRWHAGYAASRTFLSGPFAALTYLPAPWLRLLLEHDSRRLNFGGGLQLGPVALTVARLGEATTAAWTTLDLPL